MTSTPTTDRYAFSNSAAEADQQLASLAAYLDPITARVFDEIGVPPGGRCLEVGAGGGSVTRMLADRVGPTGTVVAVDIDPSKVTPAENVEIHQHDIREGLPVAGPFDVIHIRLVLLHLAQRRQVLRMLADALAPGGWLVAGEFSGHRQIVLATPGAEEAALFTRVTGALRRVLEEHGTDVGWAHQLHGAMVEAGLQRVHTIEHAQSWTGGGAGARLNFVNSLQKQAALLAAGITEEELVRFRELVSDPRFSARSLQFVCTRAQRPE